MMNGQTFLDCEIHITARRDDHYPVHIRLGEGQDFAGQILVESVIPWIATDNQVADGKRLFAALFADPELRRAWDVTSKHPSQRRIRFWLDTDTPELHTLPWELLHDGQTFLAADAATPFSRYLPSDTPWGGLVTERPIRILAVISSPADLDQYNLTLIDVAAERTLLIEALGVLAPTHFRLEFLEAPVTLERLERALASGPHVLHFVGHGAFSQRQEQATLYLQDDAGNTQVVTETQLSDMLRRQETLPSLIFLAACQSAERSTVDAFAGLAPRLVQTGIPAVVAMQDQVAISATRKLTPVFYEELARHGEVDRALNAARSLLLTGQPSDAATPVLLMRLKEGQLWEPLWAKTNPYRGLAAFTEADATFFFGREALITELSDKVRRQRFIAVVGPSGSGKSSVVQAGLLPKLPKDWQVIKLRPGNDPYANEEWRTFYENWQNGRLSFADSLIRRFIILIDQFEELFALCYPDVQTCFLDDMQALIASPTPITVILTLRADFFGHLQNSPLGKHLEHALVNVLPMEPADLRAAIAKPAQAVGLHFEAGLVETIGEDARQARHTLPLLQFALTQLWEHQTQGTLTYEAYVASGWVAAAIGLWAEDTYNGMTDAEQRLAHRVFTRLVHYGEGDAADTRQRRALPELLTHPDERDTLQRLLRRLADARLLTTGEAQGVEFVEIIHDALLKEWPRLEQWLNEQREFYLWRQRLDIQLQIWQVQPQAEDALLRGTLLNEATHWQQMYSEGLNQDECAFIQTSQESQARHIAEEGVRRQREVEQAYALVEEQQKRAEEQTRFTRRLRIALSVAIMFLLVAVIGFFMARNQANQARNAEATAVAEGHIRATAQAETEVRRIDAENAKATAEAERVRAEQQAQVALARQLGPQAQVTWRQLTQYPNHLPRASLLAVESLRRYPESEANQVIADALKLLPREVALVTHEKGVSAVAFSPDGKWVVSGGYDGTARVWEVATGREVARVTHDEGVNAVAFSPDGQWVVSGSDDSTARVWEALTGREVARITHYKYVIAVTFSSDGLWVISGGGETVQVWEVATGHEVARMTHEGGISAVAFSPDGKWVVSGGYDGTARVWEVATGREVAHVTHDEKVNAVAFSLDGRWVISGSEDNTARVWEALTGNEIASVSHADSVLAVAFSPDGRWVVSAGGFRDHTARVWEATTGREIARITHKYDVKAAAFSLDGRWVVSGSRDGTARVWEAATGREIARMTHDGEVYVVAFSSNGQWVISGGGDRTMRVWDVSQNLNPSTATGREVSSVTHEEYVTTVAFSPDGRWVVSGSADGTARVWEAATGHEVARMRHEDLVNAVAFSPDGQWVVSGGSDGTARVWETTTGREIARMTHDGGVNAVAFSTDGRWVVSGSADNTARVWEAATGREVSSVTHGKYVITVAFSLDGRWVVSGSADGTARVWEAATGHEVARMRHENSVNAVAFSPDGQWVVSGGSDGTARIWETTTGREIAQMAHELWVETVAFSPDGRWVVSGSADNTARVWEAATGHEVARMRHEDSVNAVAFSPDGQWVVSGSGDSTAQVWEAATGREVARLMHEWSVNAVAFSLDGRWVVSGSGDSTARVWWWQPEDMIRLACERLTRNLTREEWKQYLGDEPYRATCPNLPVPEETQP